MAISRLRVLSVGRNLKTGVKGRRGKGRRRIGRPFGVQRLVAALLSEILPHKADCRPEFHNSNGFRFCAYAARRPFFSRYLGVRLEPGLWNSRKQAAWSCQYAGLQSGDQSPHSKRGYGWLEACATGSRSGRGGRGWCRRPGRARESAKCTSPFSGSSEARRWPR